MVKKRGKQETTSDPTTKRLDAMIRLMAEVNKPEEKRKLNESAVARILKLVELTPTETPRILGGRSRTSVAGYLYNRKKRQICTTEDAISARLEYQCLLT